MMDQADGNPDGVLPVLIQAEKPQVPASRKRIHVALVYVLQPSGDVTIAHRDQPLPFGAKILEG